MTFHWQVGDFGRWNADSIIYATFFYIVRSGENIVIRQRYDTKESSIPIHTFLKDCIPTWTSICEPQEAIPDWFAETKEIYLDAIHESVRIERLKHNIVCFKAPRSFHKHIPRPALSKGLPDALFTQLKGSPGIPILYILPIKIALSMCRVFKVVWDSLDNVDPVEKDVLSDTVPTTSSVWNRLDNS